MPATLVSTSPSATFPFPRGRGDLEKVSPLPLLEMRFGYISSRCIGAAVELGLFEALEERPADAEELAIRLGCSSRGIRSLSDSLVTMGLLSRDQHKRLLLTEITATYLLSSRPDYIGGMIVAADRQWQRWSNLAQTVRDGAPPTAGIESDEDDGKFFSAFVQGLYNLNRPAAEETAERLYRGDLRVADIGCGSAVWSIPWAQRGARVVAVDRKNVWETSTLPYTQRAGVSEAYEFRPGNLRDIQLEEAAYDVILLGHVLHSEGHEGSLTLLGRCHRALKPGGRVVIAEMVPDDDKCQDLYGVLFGIFMLMMTTEGQVFSASELEQLLANTGFLTTQWWPASLTYPVLVGTK